MTDIQEIHLTDVAPHYETTRIENLAADERGKENLLVEDARDNFSPLFSKSAQVTEKEPDMVQKMRREYRLLLQLRSSGVTPIPLLFKTNEDWTEGNLLTTTVKGKSLEGLVGDDEITDVARDKFDEVVNATLSSLDAVHTRGVLVRDVNSGTFVVDGINEPEEHVRVSVVDFELGAERDDMVSLLNKYKYGQWYARDDLGYGIADATKSVKLDFEVAKKVERHVAIQELFNAFLNYGDHIDLDALSPEDQVLYKMQYARIEPGLRRYFELKKSDYAGMSPDVLQRTMVVEMEAAKHRIMANITLPYLLEREGLNVSQETRDFLIASLSPFIEDRPDNYESGEQLSAMTS